MKKIHNDTESRREVVKKNGKPKTPKKTMNVKGIDWLKDAIKDIHNKVKTDPDYKTPEEIIIKPPKRKYKNTEINHEAFVLEYIKTGCTNATIAYQAVYPKVSKRTATVNWSKLLTITDIQQLLRKHLEPIMAKRKIDAEFVLEELSKNLDVCMQRRQVKREERKVIPSMEEGWEDLSIVEVFDTTPQYNAKEANKALETIAKCIGMMKEEDKWTPVVNNVFIWLPDNNRWISQNDQK